MQAEYERIQRDLAALLVAKDYSTFQQLHPGLQRALNDMDGYTTAESRQLTASERETRLENLQAIAQKMTGRIFYGDHHIFYLRVMRLKDAVGNFVLPPLHLEPSVTDHTAHYLLQNNYLYVIDIVNLGDAQSRNLTPNLWLYERPQTQQDFTFVPQTTGFPQNPFSLWAPAAMPDMREGFPGIIRLDALRLSALWHAHDYELVETNGTVVLALEFRVQSVHGAQAGPAQSGMHMSELLLQLQECGEKYKRGGCRD